LAGQNLTSGGGGERALRLNWRREVGGRERVCVKLESGRRAYLSKMRREGERKATEASLVARKKGQQEKRS